MRNGEATSYSVLLAGTILSDELNHRAQRVFQRHFDGTATRTYPCPPICENSEASHGMCPHAERTLVSVFLGGIR